MATTPAKAARAASTNPGFTTVRALVPVQYDDERYEPGDTFDARAKDLAQLLDVAAVELADAGAPAA